MKILHKYVLKEHLGPLIFSLATLTSLLLLNYIAKQFGNLVGKGLPLSAILEFCGLSVPFTVALSFPMAVLVATLYAFGRLAAENEITALKASGVGMGRILAPVLWAAVGVTLFMVLFNDQVMPRSNHQLAKLQSDIFQKKPTLTFREQVINEVQRGKLYLRASRIDEASNRMRQVTIYDLSDAQTRRTIYADSGDLAMTPDQVDLLLTLYHGSMQDVPTNDAAQLQRLYFDVDHVTVKGVGNAFQQSAGGQQKTEREMTVCEMSKVVHDAWTSYSQSHMLFEQNVVQARAMGMKNISDSLLTSSSEEPPRFTLGQLYCRLTEYLKIPAAEAQQPDTTAMSAGTVVHTVPRDTSARDSTASDSTKGDSAKGNSAKGDSAKAAASTTTAGPKTPAPKTAEPKAAATVKTPRTTPGTAAVPATKGDSTKAPGTTPRTTGGTMPGKPVPIQRPVQRPAAPTPTPAPAVIQSAQRPSHTAQVQRPFDANEADVLPNIISMQRLAMVESLNTVAKYDIEIHKKFALAVACFVFVLLGAPIALKFPRGGVGLTIGVSLIVFALYYVGLIAGASLAERRIIPAWISMWASNVLFTIIALLLLRSVRGSGSTRSGDAGEVWDNVRTTMRRWLRAVGIGRHEENVA